MHMYDMYGDFPHTVMGWDFKQMHLISQSCRTSFTVARGLHTQENTT